MEYVFKLMIRAHIYLILIILISYVVERITGLILLVKAFSQEKKDKEQAVGVTDLFTFLYSIYLLFFLVYDVYIAKNAKEGFAFWKWLIVVIPLTILFWKFYHKYQGREPGIKDSK